MLTSNHRLACKKGNSKANGKILPIWTAKAYNPNNNNKEQDANQKKKRYLHRRPVGRGEPTNRREEVPSAWRGRQPPTEAQTLARPEEKRLKPPEKKTLSSDERVNSMYSRVQKKE